MSPSKRFSAGQQARATQMLRSVPGAPYRALWRRPWVLITVVTLALGLILVSVVLSTRDTTVAEQKTDQTQQTLGDVADPVAKLCASDASVRARVGAACTTAQDAVNDPEIPGPRGPAGSQGEPGPAGDPGINGANGIDGLPGPAGLPGTNGVNGQPGAGGTDGPQGPVGSQGPAGQNGVDGATGPAGPPGADGLPGPAGAGGNPATTLVLQGAGPDGADLNCVRTNDDPTAPIYTCS